jgi:hypothetical protein
MGVAVDQHIRNIVVVGGGTSGWLSAVLLQRVLNPGAGNGSQGCRVTLVESSDIGTIGVGEATIPTIKRTFKACGIDEADWMVRCNASFKLAIRFANWSAPGEVFWHPFGPMPSVGGFHLAHHWLARRALGAPEPFDASCFPVIAACEAKRAPKRPGDPPFEGAVTYAYQLDAGLLATYLKELGKRRGVHHVVDDVVDVEVDERRYIRHVRTRNHGELAADLFIDATGFRGLLINQALEEPFVSFGDTLLCDRAVAMRIPTDAAADGINPYTSATALSAGWAWNIPLYERSGDGYVYSSAFTTPEEAEQELRAHLGPRAEGFEAQHIRMRIGKTRNTWVNNCVAVGLSGGFIEPLESTGIFFLELGLFNLWTHFPDKTFHPGLIAQYNRIMTQHYEQIRDFVVIHYCTTRREDTPFWKANRHDLALSPSLRTDLDVWSATLPNHSRLDERRFFDDYSYTSILAGMGAIPERPLPLFAYGSTIAPDDEFSRVAEQAAMLRASLPDHFRYLESLRDGSLQPGPEGMAACSAHR